MRTLFGTFILIIATGAATTAILMSLSQDGYADNFDYAAISGHTQTFVHIGGTVVLADIADTEEKRTIGLSSRNTLSPDAGMLFLFPEEGHHGIWMKHMRFPIDIIWISKDFRIVDIKKNVSPDTYPDIFRPSSPALYILETTAGFSDKYTITTKEKVSW
jgi:uncharacterized membrane protein (UPF0127 family)